MRSAEDWEHAVSAASHLGKSGELVRFIKRVQADAMDHCLMRIKSRGGELNMVQEIYKLQEEADQLRGSETVQ